MPKSADALAQWLALTWERPERSYNPEVREFFVALLGYPKNKVITEDRAPIGYPDVKLLTDEGVAWVVGDLKKDDVLLQVPDKRQMLWQDKRKYVEGLTRYVLFLTAHFFWIVTPDGQPIPGLETPLDLRTVTLAELQIRLDFLRYERATHARQWADFVQGELPYTYLTLDNPDTLRQLRSDLRAGFQELTDAATRTMQTLEADYREYDQRRKEIEQNLVGHKDTQRRALVRIELEYGFVRRLFEVTEEPTGTRPIQVMAGRSLAVAWSGKPAGWVDLDAVAARPYGKLSLWRQERNANTAIIQVAEIVLAPFASVDGEQAALNTIIVGEPKSAMMAKAIAAYINSSLARFYWALKLRSGVIQGFYTHIYPRTLDVMPWPKTMTLETEQALADGYDRLSELAKRAKNNPNEWLLAETERRLQVGRLRLTEPSLGLRFLEAGAEALVEELAWEENRLDPLAEFANPALAEYVYHLLTLTSEEATIIKAADVQKLLVPTDYAALLAEYHMRSDAFRQVEQDFRTALTALDTAVYTAFGLMPEEQDTITQRLNRFPLDRLQPRYPWQAVRPRPIKAYMEDRFA